MFGKRLIKRLVKLENRIVKLEKEVAGLQNPFSFEIGDKVDCIIRGYMESPEEKFSGMIVERTGKIELQGYSFNYTRYNTYKILVDGKKLREAYEGNIEKKK